MMKLKFYLAGILLICSSKAIYADELKQDLASSSSQQKTWLYTVIKGDSFERIYKKYLTRRANILALSQLNHHKLSKKLQPNQVFTIPVDMLRKIPASAEVLVTYGDVTATTAAINDQNRVNQGDSLSAGSYLRTGKNSVAKLRFADGSITNLQPNSSLSIQSSFRYAGIGTYVIQLKLAQGRTDTTANPTHQTGNSMQIETPSAVAAVRGTEFRVSANGDASLEETLEGQVGFRGAGKEVLIAKGFGSAVEKDKAPLPPILLPDEPDVSLLAKQVNSMPVEFDLAPRQDGATYITQLARDAGFSQILGEQATQSDVTQPTKISFDQLAEGQYYLKIRAQEQHGLQGKDAIHVFNMVAASAPPQLLELIEPLDGAIIPLAPTLLSWTNVPLANNYIVQIVRDVNFENKIFELVTSSNQLTLNNSFGAGQFYWRVAVLNAGKPQKFSNYRMFKR
jgi:hypothetical protein